MNMARVLTAPPAGDGHQDTAPLLKNGQTYNAVLTEILDTQKRKYQSEEYEDAYRLVFTLSNRRGEEIGTVSKKYKPSIHEKATLTKVIKAITGKTPAAGFDVDSLIGKPCRVLIELWSTDQGADKNGIGSVLPPEQDDDDPAPSGAAPRAALQTIDVPA